MKFLIIIIVYINISSDNKGKTIDKLTNRIIYTKLKKFYFTFLPIFYNNITKSGKHVFKHFFVDIIILAKIFIKQVFIKQNN